MIEAGILNRDPGSSEHLEERERGRFLKKKRVIEAGVLNRDPGSSEHLEGRERGRDMKQRFRKS